MSFRLSDRRAVITGAGVVSTALIGGAAALGTFLASPRRQAGALGGEVLARLVEDSDARRLSRVCQLTVAAARLAAADAGLDPDVPLGLAVGTELGDLRSTVDFADGFLVRGPGGLSPLLFPNTVMNTMAARAAIALRAREASLTLTAPIIAGDLAIARAAASVAAGRANCVVAGGVDQLDPLVEMTMASLGANADVRGEGAAFLVIESLAAAESRGARVLGEILGTATGALPAPLHGVGRRAASRAVGRALANAGVPAGALAWVYGSASGDRPRDGWEVAVLAAALAPHRPPVTSLTPLVGQHAGLGALKVAAAAWTARSGLLPIADPDGHAEIRMARVSGRVGLVHGLARGGGQAALVVGPPP